MRHEPTSEENNLWQRLRNHWVCGYKFRWQHPLEWFIVDFCCPEAGLVVEVDGPIHENTPEQDTVRQEYLQSLGTIVLRLSNEQINRNLPMVLEAITHALKAS
jgi:very-short-patch-repair endonuclease